MRWEDEQFVKVYTRDTGEWLALGWEAQALFLFMLRKSDRAGIVHTGKAKARGLAAMVGMPPEVLERALAVLLDDGCVREAPAAYLIPNFVAAQEARQTDRARKAAQRQRDRDEAASHGVTQPAVADAMATIERHESHEVTHAVTRRHTASHGVTLRLDETRVDETRREAPPNLPEGVSHRDVGYIPPRNTPTSPTGAHPFEAEPEAPAAESLQEGLSRVNREARGSDYPWDGRRDGEAARALLALAGKGGVPEILRRFGHGVRARFKQRVDTLSDLVKRWNANAQPEPEAQAPPGKPQRRDIRPEDYREGPVERL